VAIVSVVRKAWPATTVDRKQNSVTHD